MTRSARFVFWFLFCISAFVTFPAFALEHVSGEYAVYRDLTWKNPSWIGFLRYDANTWGAFVKTPSTGSDVSVLFRAEEVDGELILTGQNIISDISERDVPAVNYLMGLLPDLYSWSDDAFSGRGVSKAKSATGSVAGTAPAAASVRSALLPPLITLERSAESFGGDLSLVFAAEIPVFSLHSASVPGKGTVLELVKAGRVVAGFDRDFFGFAPRLPAKDAPPFVLSKERTPLPHTVDGLLLTLDSQWTQLADNTFMLGNTAVLIADTVDLAGAGLSGDLPTELARLFSSSNKASWILPENTAVRGTKEKFVIENRVFDETSQLLNRDIKVCIPSADGASCRILSLTVSDAAWTGNESYFNLILSLP